MRKLQYSEKKILKLTNVIRYKLITDEEEVNINIVVEQMKSYIKSKGAMQVGPLIQYTRTYLNVNNEIDMEIHFMLQCNNYIHNVEQPYYMDSIIRIQSASYCRYIGPENSLKFAYDKISLEAFERNIKLAQESYTIFVDSDEEDGIIIADVFMERID